jgi:cation diffusion facilitator family transporter
MLGVVALFMGIESIQRFLNPHEINFNIAIGVSVLGLIVNLISAVLLSDNHGHDHSHHHGDHVHDHNHQSALVHVIADAFTSVLAIVALILGKTLGWSWADPAMGIVGALVILKWAYSLCTATVWELLDGNSKLISEKDIKDLFKNDNHLEITDLHIWRIAPNAHACELVIYNDTPKGSEYYRDIILSELSIEHLIIEERRCIH